MLRKMLLIAAATAMPLGFMAAVGGSAGAGAPKVNATDATVSCTGITGSVKIKPAITSDEAAGLSTISIKAKLSGCTTNDGVTVTSASVKGALTSTRTAGENGCAELASGTGGTGESGTLTTKWKTTPALSSGSSVIHPTSFSGTLLGSGYVAFSIPGSTPNGTPSGSFQGTNAGASDQTTGQTKETGVQLITACGGKKGLSTIDLTSSASPPSVTLG